MPDIVDDAQAHEAQYLASCLAMARARAPDGPQERDGDGRVICAECGELIPLARMALVPTATMCVGCQNERDGHP